VKVTIKNIAHFLEGNLKMLGEQVNLLPDHQREQVLYRSQICKEDCLKLGYCIECGCSVPGKMYVTESCNSGKRFPDLMNQSDWEKFKKEKGLKFNLK
jgi:hypothetical protein